jgi:hypothetical protein
LNPLAFSSLWVAAAAGALVVACSLAMGIPAAAPAVGLAFTGTLVIYNVDRLRDLERDRKISPLRSAFVERHRNALTGLTASAGIASLAFAIAAGVTACLVLAPVLALGLMHRRIKHLDFGKSAYITVCWVVVVAGVPVAVNPAAAHLGWVVPIIGCAAFANAIASNIRDFEVAAARFGVRPALFVARLFAAAGSVLGMWAPPVVRPLLAVPLATLAVLVPFRPSERYGLVWVDGALLAGALAAAAVSLL